MAGAQGALRRHLAGVARGGADGQHGRRVQRADRGAGAVPGQGLAGARIQPKTGNPVYERPVALVIYRDDFRFLLDDVIPRQGRARADYDLVIASQPYRARVPVEFKAAKVIAPLARALRPGGRLLGIHSCGRDPGLEIVRKMWPEENPFQTTRHDILRAVRAELGRDARHYNFNAYADQRAVFRYDMHTLPTEIAASIGTSTLFAAWNAAVYVAQIDDERLAEVLGARRYLDATREVLQAHGQPVVSR